jgi:rhodanese-related sulfurtransferase
MKASLMRMLSAALLALVSLSASADELGITPQKAYEMAGSGAENLLFIDVRDPVEIMFVGFTDSVDLNIPYLLVDRTQWDPNKPRFRVYRNPDFLSQVEQALAERGLSRDATIITMCRSGSERGLPSATYLRENGFPNAFYVVNGFQGDKAKGGDQAGMRVLNGWQNEGLPWSPSPNPDKIYRVDR